MLTHILKGSVPPQKGVKIVYKYKYKYLYKYGPSQAKGVVSQIGCPGTMKPGRNCEEETGTPPTRFYKDVDNQGDSFGLCVGDECAVLPLEWNDHISSIAVAPRSQVTLYEDFNSGGHSIKFQNMSRTGSFLKIDLTDYHFGLFPPKSWNDQVSSIKVEPFTPFP
jgi:hypothetical protein